MPDTRTLHSTWLRRGLGAAAAGVAGLAVHDAARILAIKRVADRALVLDHDAVVGDGLGEPLTLVVLGDSAAAGHGIADPADALPQRVGVKLAKAAGRRVAVRSVAVSGATTGDVLKFQVPQLRDGRADVAVLNVGVNDALSGRVPDDLEAQTIALIDSVRQHVPSAHVVFVETPDLSHAPGIPWASGLFVGRRCRRVRRVQRVAARRAGLPVVELPGDLDSEAFGDDGFHPGPAGLDAVADLVVAEIATD